MTVSISNIVALAQIVEHRFEKPSVAGAIPARHVSNRIEWGNWHTPAIKSPSLNLQGLRVRVAKALAGSSPASENGHIAYSILA